MAKYNTSILVTGGTQGMGFRCSLAIAKQCPDVQVFIASRTDPDDAASAINKTLKQSNVRYLPLDLGSLAKVRDFAASWKAGNYPPIQTLLLNAGVHIMGGVQYSEDGLEKNFAINHVGHALLFHLLLPCLTPDARIVVTASGVHDPAEKWMSDPHWTNAEEMAHPGPARVSSIAGSDRYAATKLANILWAKALARHLSKAASGKLVVIMDPGFMPGTGLFRNAPAPFRFAAKKIMPKAMPLLRATYHENTHTPEESGQALAWLSTTNEVKGQNGGYFEGKRVKASSPVSMEEAKQEDLWKWTVEFLCVDGSV
ncbi:dehydrogenase/reductase [Massariosphaeria phaeospora]|uniref:Dehydrogenase/reductase n=1 Tax=Massariosphaeria phaeospora TaxID=100035 RepID=A0A7C8M3B0_9PLEO|nr:dehydrogenase/reductase [Massariosphaeria phaeospora]